MTELRVPELEEDPFREHYRQLILGSVLHAAEIRSELEQASGHGIRARRAAREAARLRGSTEGPPSEAAPPRRFGRELRSSIRMVWLATLALLVLDVVAFGVESWTTSVADIGLIVLTLVWFWLCADDLVSVRKPEPEQLELFL